MTFDEVLSQVQELLQREKRISYGGLKRRFGLDEEYLEDLKDELIGAKRLATDEDGRFLVWRGILGPVSAPSRMLSASPPASPAVELRTLEAERRQLTVEFIDLVGSTMLSQQLDPEELLAVIQAYRETCASVIRRFEGHLAKYIGDGLLVYFTYPVAHEDDAQRAVRAGLDIVAALPELNVRLQSTLLTHGCAPLQVRIGIHTGLVVAGEMGVGDQPEPLAIVGETPNIAARLQEKATPNSVVISSATHRLVSGLFEYEWLGPQILKGISTPMVVCRVVRESPAQSRFEVAVRTGLTPLVGREEELALLQRRWEQAKAGAGQALLLSGEPGIGKSRLAQTLKERVDAEGATKIEFRCSPYHQNSALYPIIDNLQRLLQFSRADAPAVKLEKLQLTLSPYRFLQADTVPLLASLLSLPHPESAPPLTLSPQKQKQKTHEAVVAWLMEEAENAPVYCAWEDLHWADPSTLDVLTLFLDQVPATRLLAVLTFRPEFLSPWENRSHLSRVMLSRLGRPQVEVMVERVTGGKTLPPEVVQQIVAKTDGVPLFVEELTKMVVELGLLTAVNNHYELNGTLPPLAIPATLQDSLMARLDRLSTARELAQLGATLGREFSYELLHAVSPLSEERLQQGLGQLVEKELVYQRGVPPRAQYRFKHALIQDTAYQALLKSTRRQYHQRIAQVLEEKFPEITETEPELLAHHCTEAGLIEQALLCWQQAGQRAAQRSANAEAVGHFTKGLALLKTLPDTPERAQQELGLQVALGGPLIATKGHTVPEVGRVYGRARELCHQVGESPQLFPVVIGLWRFHWVRAELETARELAEQLLRLAQSLQDPALLLEAHYMLGNTLLILGELVSAQEHFEQGITLYNPQQHRSHAFLYGLDPGVGCQSYSAGTLHLLGYPDQALQRIAAALALAQELSHPFSLAVALLWAGTLHQFRREAQLAQERAEAVITLSTEQGFSDFLVQGTILKGWALAEQGETETGITQMHHWLTIWHAMGAELFRSLYFASLADAYGQGGQAEAGLARLAEALVGADKTGERWQEAELYRLKGKLLLAQEGRGIQAEGCSENRKKAEVCFLQAIDIARKQQAKSLQLPAAVSLARLWQQQGQRNEAREVLSEIYHWFTEGLDMKDLQEAKVLLEELN
jgi:predicted ATPase/class 3 adenylate cyclase